MIDLLYSLIQILHCIDCNKSQLLAYLMRHPHQLLTHSQIQQQLWGEGEQPSSNVLAAQIRLLRRKIETKRDLPLIHTVYGKGYRFGSAGDS